MGGADHVRQQILCDTFSWKPSSALLFRGAGAALLAAQPAMAEATAGQVAAVLAAGVPMHKAWIKAAKQTASGSHR